MALENTNSDINDLLRHLAQRALLETDRQYQQIVAERAAKGALLSGATIIALSRKGGEALEKLAVDATESVQSASARLGIPISEFSEQVREVVKQFPLQLTELPVVKNLERNIRRPSVPMNMLAQMSSAKAEAESTIRRLDLGLIGPAPSISNVVHNSISAHQITAANIQVGNSNSARNARFHLALKRFLTRFSNLINISNLRDFPSHWCRHFRLMFLP